MDICIADGLHLYAIVAILNILLYAIPCIKFDSFWCKIVHAADFGLLLKTVVETAIGSNDGHWPQDSTTNLFIALCFTLFFYILAPNIWGTIFLVIGLLSVQSFWDGVYDQLMAFSRHSLAITIDATHAKTVFACILLFVLFTLAVSIFFSLPWIQTTTQNVVTSIKLVVAVRLLFIQLVRREEVCCSENSDPSNCPLWMSPLAWISILVLIIARITIVHNIDRQGCCSSRGNYKLLPPLQLESSDSELQTKKSTSLRSKSAKLKTIKVQSTTARPYSFRSRSGSL